VLLSVSVLGLFWCFLLIVGLCLVLRYNCCLVMFLS